MRLFSPLNVLLLIILWTAVFLFFVTYYLYGAHQSLFKEEEAALGKIVEFKIDNLDARNMRQLNQMYAEILKVQGMLEQYKSVLSRWNASISLVDKGMVAAGGPPKAAVPPSSPDAMLVDKRAVPDPVIAVLVIACNRVDYMRQTLDSLLKYRPSAGLFPIIVSQDCGHIPTAQAIAQYTNRVKHIRHPDVSDVVIAATDRKMKNRKTEQGYFKISRHYKWALTQVFDELSYDYVIIVEDDLVIALDFFSYFSALRPLLDADPSVMCVSAWNDNGKEILINHQQNDVLYRTDFFPGLGWMLTKKLWLELKPKWPLKFWDDWLREPEQRQDRVCIRPEVSRSITIGLKGVSHGEYYNNHLKFITLNKDPVDFARKNLTYLMKDVYDKMFVSLIDALPLVSIQDVVGKRFADHKEVKVQYSSKKEFERFAKQLKIMPDFRGGVPRTGYMGVVGFMSGSVRVHLVPPTPWKGYTHLL